VGKPHSLSADQAPHLPALLQPYDGENGFTMASSTATIVGPLLDNPARNRILQQVNDFRVKLSEERSTWSSDSGCQTRPFGGATLFTL